MAIAPRRRVGALAALAAVMSFTAATGCGGGSNTSGGAAEPGTSGGGADVALAKEQAEDFRTLGMPDEWNNYGEFFQSVCDSYDLGCAGSGRGPNRQDTDMTSAEEVNSFISESSDPGMCADIGITFGQVADDNDALLEYTPEAAEKLPAGYRAANGGWVATSVGVISILTNLDVVPNPPTSWADLQKPEYQGLITIKNPSKSGTGQAMLFSVAAALGSGPTDLDTAIEYFKEVSKAGQFNRFGYSAASFERGETPIVLFYDYVNLQTAKLAEAKGIKTSVTIPSEGGVWSPSAIMCNKRTKDPDLAKLTLDHALSDEGQLVFASAGARPIRYVLDDLEVPADVRANWLPESQYEKVVEFPVDEWPDPVVVGERWEREVVGGG